jgi:predicted transcriptional regulator
MPRDTKADSKSMVGIGLGCEAKHAQRIGYADGCDPERGPATGIGPTCHICERVACPDRSLPPVTRSLDLHPLQRSVSPYPFRRL